MKEVDDREKDVGMEGGAHIQTLEACGHGVDNMIAGVELY